MDKILPCAGGLVIKLQKTDCICCILQGFAPILCTYKACTLQYSTKPFITSIGLNQYQIGRLIMLFANSRFIWPSRITLLMQLLHFSFKTLDVPKTRTGLSSLCHQTAKGPTLPSQSLPCSDSEWSPSLWGSFWQDPREMCWRTAEWDVVSSPDVPAPWKSQHVFQFRGYPPSPNFFPWILPHIFTFFAGEERHKFFFPFLFLLNT